MNHLLIVLTSLLFVHTSLPSLGVTLNALADTISEQAQIKRSFPLAKGKKVEVLLQTGTQVRIQGWKGSTIELQADLAGADWKETQMSFAANQHGVQITSRFKKGRIKGATAHVLQLKVPFQSHLYLESEQGDVLIEDFQGQLAGYLQGQLKASRLQGHLQLSLTKGDIEITHSQLEGQVSTLQGAVTLRQVSGGLQGRATQGSVRIEQDTTQAPLVGFYPEGNLVYTSLPHPAQLAAVTGSIQVGVAEDNLKATANGSITVLKAKRDVYANSLTGPIAVTMLEDSSDRKRTLILTTLNGDVTLSLPTNFSMDLQVEMIRTKDHTKPYKLKSDFPLESASSSTDTNSSLLVQRFLEGKNTVIIRATNGNVYLKKSN